MSEKTTAETTTAEITEGKEATETAENTGRTDATEKVKKAEQVAKKAKAKREQPRPVPREILNSWKLLRERGDVQDIRLYSDYGGKKLSRQAIMNALRGFATTSTQTIIDNYYKIKSA